MSKVKYAEKKVWRSLNEEGERCSTDPRGYYVSTRNQDLWLQLRNAKCKMYNARREIAKKKLDPNVENRKEKKEKLRTGGNARRASRGTGCLWISSNAHDPPRLSLWKDQRPLREDLGQPLLPFVVVVYDRLDELMNAYGSSSTRSLVTDLDIELNLGVDARFSRILSEQEKNRESDILETGSDRFGAPHLYVDVGSVEVRNPLR